jgi:lincosamide nucleotidyltransferase A/C/D/E
MLHGMEASDVIDLLKELEDLDVHYWLDGGWGIDCLLGEQSRPHSDLDLVVPRPNLDRVRGLLASRGYAVIRDWLPSTLALRDDQGREVDLHPVDMTGDGGGDQVLIDGEIWHYAPPVEGSIAGRAVRCSSADDQPLMHQGYEPRLIDTEDVRRIADRFGLPVPAAFEDHGEVT